MNRPIHIIGAAAFAVAFAVAGAGYVYRKNLDFYLRTGHFSPVSIVECLAAPVAIVDFSSAGLRTAEGSRISLPGVSGIEPPPAVLRDVKKYGVELAPDGSVFALVRERPCALSFGEGGSLQLTAAAWSGREPWCFRVWHRRGHRVRGTNPSRGSRRDSSIGHVSLLGNRIGGQPAVDKRARFVKILAEC